MSIELILTLTHLTCFACGIFITHLIEKNFKA